MNRIASKFKRDFLHALKEIQCDDTMQIVAIEIAEAAFRRLEPMQFLELLQEVLSYQED